MAFTYVNRKGKTYYIHEGKTRTGKPRYTVSLRSEGNILDSIPEGFEFYENPTNAQVLLRKIQPKIISDFEIKIVQKAVKELTDVKYYIVDCKKNVISIYLTDQDVDEIKKSLEMFPSPHSGVSIEDILKEAITYSERMQFVLKDEEKRIFIARRYCYLGRIDDWINIGEPDSLGNLVKKYIKHLGEDSYYELF
jgi:hypothetical protein